MIPVFQTKFGADGNCFSACLASLLELNIDDVPNFYEIGGAENVTWWNSVREWLEQVGLGLVVMSLPSIECIDYLKGIHIVSGETIRGGGILHATLWESGKMIHDPHPLGDGLTSLIYVCFLYPLDAAQFRKALWSTREISTITHPDTKNTDI